MNTFFHQGFLISRMIVINSRSRILISVCSLIIASSNVLACHFDFEARTFGSLNECQKICHFSLTLNSTPRRSYDKKNAATRTGDSVKFCIIYLIGKFYNSTLPFPFLPYFIPYHIRFPPYFYRTTARPHQNLS